MKVKFKQWDCETRIGWYSNGNLGIILVDVEDGGTVAKATINTDVELPESQVAIKDYSENEGITEALLKAGVIKKFIKTIFTGYLAVPVFTVCKDLISESKVIGS